MLAEAAPDALCGELDRRQRVLDLVGNAARHLAPCRHPLHLDELRVVVENEYHAQPPPVFVLQQGEAHEQRQHLVARGHLELPPDALA